MAEILPLESADMYWWSSGKRYYIEAMDDGDFNEEEGHIRAWSLAALLGVLPSGYVIVKNYHSLYYVESRDHGKSTNIFNNPIDACVAMIEKLNEFKMV